MFLFKNTPEKKEAAGAENGLFSLCRFLSLLSWNETMEVNKKQLADIFRCEYWVPFRT